MRWVTYVLLLALAGLQYSLWLGKGSWEDMQHLATQVEEQKRLNDRLRLRNHALSAEVRDLREGSDALAEIVRTDLGYIQEGEVFYRFVYVPESSQ